VQQRLLLRVTKGREGVRGGGGIKGRPIGEDRLLLLGRLGVGRGWQQCVGDAPHQAVVAAVQGGEREERLLAQPAVGGECGCVGAQAVEDGQ